MTGPFVLEIYKPHPKLYTPQGGSTYIPLTGDWLKSDGVTRYGVAFSVSDTDPFDFGGQMPNLMISKTLSKLGDKIQDYSRKTRNFKCSVYATGDTLALAKYGVQELQAALIEATQFSASSFANDGFGDGQGTLLFLKYQPDSTSKVTYFQIISGFVDVSKANDQVSLNANIMKITLNLRIPYAGFTDAVWLQNLVPNGTCAYALDGYAFSGVSAPAYDGSIPSIAGPGKVNWYLDIPGQSPRLATSGANSPQGIEMAWGMTGGSSDVWSGFAYNAGGQAGTDIVYTPETPIVGNSTKLLQYLWLSFEYKDNAGSPAFCQAQMQVWNNASGGAWYNFGSAISPSANAGWAQYAWNAALSTFGNVGGQAWENSTKFRIAFSFDRSRTFSTQAVIRKIAVWAFPATLPSAMIALPTEYVSQAADLTQSTFITSIQGNADAPVRAKLANPLQLVTSTSANTVIYQRAYIGARKYVKAPYRFYYKYSTTTAMNLGVGTNFNSISANNDNVLIASIAQYGIPVEDLRARRYRVLARMNTNGAIGTGIGLSNYGGSGPGDFQITPNGSFAEIASTGGANVMVDCGVATIPAYSIQHTDDATVLVSAPLRRPDWWVVRSMSSGTGAITISGFALWMIPTDQYMDIDTRMQDVATNYDTRSWSNYTNQSLYNNYARYTATREVVIDTIFRNNVGVYMGNSLEVDDASIASSFAYNGTGFVLSPSTPNSPEPMQFCAVVKRQGTSGAPATDATETDPISWTFMYMPAWEF